MRPAIDAVLTMWSGALPHHDRVRRRHAVDDAVEIHIEHPAPVRQRHVLRLAQDADAGVVEKKIDPAVQFCRVFDQRLDCVRVGHVELRRAPGSERVRHSLRAREVQIGNDDDLRAALRQFHADGAANPRCTAGDDGYCILE